ncbi:hypothetical protein JY651_48190 [Pyxidicoccus parkwayensis]|uniref:Lipoprotein n=1 Tax=Pyxidicoccus parkwayensis TaxID=2813578 RepID=A0ABX7NV47_9BACT|nr:hypothetical protein [Pyxidicoccus parkwaysis]QSQ22796.1 hypothetical protein JY651_48190 [Pyxidicoccus parkwaysis]
MPRFPLLATFILSATLLLGCGSAEAPVETTEEAPLLETAASALRSTPATCTSDADCGPNFCNSGVSARCQSGYCVTTCSEVYQNCCETTPGHYGCNAASILCTSTGGCPANSFCSGGVCLANSYQGKCTPLRL